MPSLRRPTSRELFLFAFLFAYTLVFSGVVLAWTAPGSNPPAGNVSAPVNIGSAFQEKSGSAWFDGGVGINSGSKFCIGTDCITSWPSGGSDIWQLNGTSAYYNAGNVGIGVASPYFALQINQPSATGGGIYVSTNGQDGTGLNGISNGYSYTLTSSATRYPIADANTFQAKVSAGVTNSGYVMGIDDTILRNYGSTADNGTLASMYGQRITYGHYSSDSGATPQTTNAFGLIINPYALNGSIGTMYDLFLSGTSGSGVTNHYGLYQSGTATDYFGGKVGIGTASPVTPLHVTGAGWEATFGTSGSALQISANQVAAQGAGALLLNGSQGGNVGIGTTNPAYMLDVAGQVNASSASGSGGYISSGNYGGTGNAAYFPSGIWSNSSNAWIYGTINTNNAIVASGVGTIRDAGGGWVRTYGNTGWYNGTYGGGWYMLDTSWIRAYSDKNVYTGGAMEAGAFYYTSDESLKKDVKTIPDALSLIKKLRGVSFEWIKDGRPDMGVIAQEVQQVLPQLVHTDPSTGLESVEYGNLVGVVIQAVKEVQGEITELQQQNAELQRQVQQLTAEQQSLEARLSALEAAK